MPSGERPQVMALCAEKHLVWIAVALALLLAGCGTAERAMQNPAGMNAPGDERRSDAMKWGQTVRSVRVETVCEQTDVVAAIIRVLKRQIEDRCEAEVQTAGEGELTVRLAIRPGIGDEGFRIADGADGAIDVIGNDARGLLYGVGKFLRTSRADRGGFSPGLWRGTSAPEKRVRGIYFATHFHNFYHDAPIEKVERYVEDLGLWGFNTLCVWYDMHHFNGFEDPEAAEFRERLRRILRAAKGIGMGVGFGVVANEGYGNSPKPLRADPAGMRGAKMESDICPSVPGGKEYVLGNFAEYFSAFADLAPETVWIWPYDSGGCGCKNCQPWGQDHFLKMAEPVAQLARREFEGARIILSTWFFTEEEYRGLVEAFREKPDWVDYILAEHFVDAGTDLPTRLGVPGGLPMVGFPEISMWGMLPWGGYGANPRPAALQAEWRERGGGLDGGFPYSEGIYEDINKALFAQFYWQADKPAEETLKEYVAFEFGPDVVEDALTAIRLLEENHPRDRIGESACRAWDLMKKSDAKLTPQARRSWRWRILYLRASIDKEMYERKGKLRGETLRQAFRELTGIYHADNALEDWLRPPEVEAAGPR
ncbi:MAG TPA: hypothetical protein VM492_09605 [Sumerlaeia bacterium]|nr:hypothetical protein [Sumerlaeia bacterium]